MKWWAAALTVAAWAEAYEATPSPARQGQTIRLRAPAEAARMNGRTVPLFDGEGLMPVPALEKPGERRLEFLSASGGVLREMLVAVRDARFPRQNVTIGKAVAELKPSPGEMETAENFRKTVSPVRHWSEPFMAPVPGCRTSPYGVRRLHNGKPTGNFHGGFDQRGAAGQPVRAVAAGEVRIVKMWNIHGGTVAVDHGQGLGSMYLHLSRFAVEEGVKLRQGDVIGYVGSTGRSTAPHLHWSLYVHGIPVDPGQWMSVPACTPARPAAKRK